MIETTNETNFRGNVNQVFNQLIKENKIKIEGDNLIFPPVIKLGKKVLEPSLDGFDSKNVYNCAVFIEDNTIFMLYRAESLQEDHTVCTGRLGLAYSQDGINFVKHDKFVMIPEYSYESRGVEDPRIVKINDCYVLTYTGFSKEERVTPRLCLAIYQGDIKDMLKNENPYKMWDKKGPIFPNFLPATKSGAILPIPLTTKYFSNSYVMIFGDTNLYLAYSKDLLNWDYFEEPIIRVRQHDFDNLLVEGGPPLILTEYGILVIYNSADKSKDGRFYHNSYYVGACLLDIYDPFKIIARTKKPIMIPEYSWETQGYVDNVVFTEGLIEKDQKILIYYGAADRYISIAFIE